MSGYFVALRPLFSMGKLLMCHQSFNHHQ